MLKRFKRYLTVGVVNTLIHWAVFLMLVYSMGANQTFSNLMAFCVATTFGFFANAKWTFNQAHSLYRYFIYVTFLGLMAVLFGRAADVLSMPPLITTLTFSLFSLVIGFLYSNFIVFKENKR
ncbi:MAG: GtrA family protein [Yersiniaceae bacterium]|nr:GtrA family protein [Yersiniaceae bacterium]